MLAERDSCTVRGARKIRKEKSVRRVLMMARHVIGLMDQIRD
jgi:hypothetical protein